MKKYSLFLVITLVLFAALSINAQGYYNKTYDFGVVDHPVAFITDSLENVYVCGWYEDENNENARAFVLKTDSNGQEIWRDTLDVPSKYFVLCLTHTGDVALAGSRNNRCFLTSLNSLTGTETWDYEEPGSEDYWFATVNEVLDDSVYKLHVVKTKYGPHHIWYYLFDPLNGNYLYDYESVVNTIYGITYTSSLIAYDRVWSAGNYNEQWGLIVNENFGSGISSLWDFQSIHIAGVHHYMDNQGCVVRNFIWSDGEYDMSVLIMDYNLFEVWGNSFEITHDIFSVNGSDKYENGKFIITGTINNELALWFIDHDLTEMEDKTIPTQNPRTGIDVVALPTSDMILMGSVQIDADSSGIDIFLMKLDDSGTVSAPENTETANFTLYPNPTKDKLWIKSSKTGMQHAEVLIINAMGETVKTTTGLNKQVSVAGLPQGLYVVLVINNNEIVLKQKFIKY